MIFHNKVKRTTYDWFCGGRSHLWYIQKLFVSCFR